ncbi:MAG: transcriptional regulator ArgR [Enterobacteriaceae bacterium]
MQKPAGKQKSLNQEFKELLQEKSFSSQHEIVDYLASQGYEQINQSKVSRMLARFGAVRGRNLKGNFVYSMPVESSVPSVETRINHLVMRIDYNDLLIVVNTSPGAASVVARILDSVGKKEGVMGTIAGSDTIFVTPCEGISTRALFLRILALLDME